MATPPTEPEGMPPGARTALLALAVGIVLADSAVVTIALPNILTRYEVGIETLSWALTSFNLALALAALPAAFAARRLPIPVFAAGAGVFAAASLLSAFAPSFSVFIAGRTVQGIAGAAVVTAALGLLADAAGGNAPAARIWAFAGIVGAAVGPAVGGILTQLFGWESIFLLQAPLILATALALGGARPATAPEPLSRPHLGANAALMLVSGALVAALFLLVILLINGWRLNPLAAGLVVTVMPIAAVAAAHYGRGITPPWARASSGVVLIGGGLAALGWLPETGAAWTVPPQLAIGAGLGLSLSALMERALAGRSSQGVHGGWTLAARHAGVVLGLLLLTPVFTADLDRNRDDALTAGTAAVLDSSIPPLQKIGVARDILVAVDEGEAEARVPDVGEVVRSRGDDPAYGKLATDLQGELDRAATNTFSHSFLAAAALGLLALVPILLDRREVSV